MKQFNETIMFMFNEQNIKSSIVIGNLRFDLDFPQIWLQELYFNGHKTMYKHVSLNINIVYQFVTQDLY